MAGKRPPDQQIRDRCEIALGCLKRMWPQWRILDALQDKFSIERKVAVLDVGRARAKLKEEDCTSRQDKRSKVSAFLEEIMENTSTQARERIRAVQQYAKLHGLEESSPMESTEVDDIEVIVPNWREEYLAQLNEGAAKSAGNGKKPTNGAKS